MSCNYCPKTYMCQCPPKCVKCCKAATIYRSTIHVLHDVPQPQHSWPWEPRTPGTNSGSWFVTSDISSNSNGHKDLTNVPVSNLIKDVKPNIVTESRLVRGVPSKMVIDDVQNSDQGPPSIAVIDGPPIFTGQISAKMIPPPNVSNIKKRKKKRSKKKKKDEETKRFTLTIR